MKMRSCGGVRVAQTRRRMMPVALKPSQGVVAGLLLGCFVGLAEGGLEEMVQADWAAQERRLGREPHSGEAIGAAFQRAERLLADLRRFPGMGDLAKAQSALEGLRPALSRRSTLEPGEALGLYRAIRTVSRELALANPLVGRRPVLFMKRHRFICQMLHEYLGYYYDYGDLAGGGVYLLEEPGRSLKTRDLSGGRFPPGNYTTLALSHDARTIYLAFAPRAEMKPDFYSAGRRCFHLFAMDQDGGNPRQLTEGPEDDFDPCPLPDGGILFMSTRRGGFTRCNNPWEPLPAHTLHRLDAAGREVRMLSFHETSEWHPSVLHDGRVVYIRWDYVDRSAAHFHGLWVAHPDGTAPRALFANYTQQINACYQPKAIPGSHRILFLAGAHHANVGGSLVILDPDRADLDPQTGEDRLGAIETLTPELCFPETPDDWPGSFFHSPWPLSENYFLVAFSFEPLPGMGSRVTTDGRTGLYYFDRFGNLELLYREAGVSCMYPIPLAPRPIPALVSPTAEPDLGEEGEFILADVRRSHFPMPKERRVTSLRVFQVLPKSRTHVANDPRIGYANAESARLLLGTVPVESDGSAYFRAPARKPLYFQAVDQSGRAVQGMRSVAYLQPGERRGCVGCHEPPVTGPPHAQPQPLAAKRRPSRIQPGPDGTAPLSFPRLVQPILDQHCVRCHDGTKGEGKSALVLTGGPKAPFSVSYENLRSYVRWYEWGGNSIEQIVTRPGRMPSDESRLPRILADSAHRLEVKLGDTEWQRIYLWLDANAPFYGTYEVAEQRAQKDGQPVHPPKLQ